jgi:rod shape-determining protein MreC
MSQQPAFFKQGPRPLSRLALFFGLSIVLLVVDARFRLLTPAREAVSVALYPLQWLATAPVSMAHRFGDFLKTQRTLQRENRRLQDERLIANAELLRMQELKLENAQLKRLLAIPAGERGPGVLTEVLYHARDPFTARLILDRGELAGVKAGQVVIDPQGVVGQITRLQPLTAEVTLVTEKNHAVPVQVVRNGLRAVVFGAGRGRPLEVRFMPASADIKEGDTLVTSGIDGVYPAGLPVAVVSKVDRATGLMFTRIECQPAADVDQHRYFLILNESRRLPPKPEVEAAESASDKQRSKRKREE